MLFNEDEAWILFRQMLDGLTTLKTAEICHRIIAKNVISITTTGAMKINDASLILSDFGTYECDRCEKH